MEDYKRLSERLDTEVEKRDVKIEGVYKKLDSHYQTLDRKIDMKVDGLSNQIADLPKLLYRRSDDANKKTEDWKGLAIMATLIVALFSLLQLQLVFMANTATQVVQDMKNNDIKQDASFQREIDMLRDEQLRIRNWKDEVEKCQGPIDARQDAYIEAMKDVIQIRSGDRFTGSQGAMMQKQVDRIEDRLTYLKKKNYEHMNTHEED